MDFDAAFGDVVIGDGGIEEDADALGGFIEEVVVAVEGFGEGGDGFCPSGFGAVFDGDAFGRPIKVVNFGVGFHLPHFFRIVVNEFAVEGGADGADPVFFHVFGIFDTGALFEFFLDLFVIGHAFDVGGVDGVVVEGAVSFHVGEEFVFLDAAEGDEVV